MSPCFISKAVDFLAFSMIEVARSYNSCLLSLTLATPSLIDCIAQATASWGTLVTFAICDHLSTGDVLYFGTLTVSKKIGTSDQAKFATGDIDVTED